MQFQTPLVRATLVRRYKRFLADVVLEDGREVTAHCGNPGAMTGLKEPGLTVWLEPNDNPKRKLRYAWKLVELPVGHWAGVDTNVANRIVAEAFDKNQIPALTAYHTIRPEVKYGTNSRIDFLLTAPDLPDLYLEVKSVTLRRSGEWAEFPDSVTTRGTKHLNELVTMVENGHRAVMLYLIQRTDCTGFRLAADIDTDYAGAFARAIKAGVEVLCYQTAISAVSISLESPVPVYGI